MFKIKYALIALIALILVSVQSLAEEPDPKASPEDRQVADKLGLVDRDPIYKKIRAKQDIEDPNSNGTEIAIEMRKLTDR